MTNTNTKWDQVYDFVSRARRRGVTSDDIVAQTGWNRSTVSSYLTHLTSADYIVRTEKTRANRNGRATSIYMTKASARA